MIRCKVVGEGGADLGWWMFAAVPRLDEVFALGGPDLPSYYKVTFLTHRPVEPNEVSEFRPPYVTLVVERFE